MAPPIGAFHQLSSLGGGQLQHSEVAERRAAALVAAVSDDQRHPLRGVLPASARDVLECYLHAAALDGRNIRSVLDWSRRIDDPTEADILRRNETAAPGWPIIAVHTAEAGETTSGGMRRRLAHAFSCFSHETVVARCCRRRSEAFDIEGFLDANGTV